MLHNPKSLEKTNWDSSRSTSHVVSSTDFDGTLLSVKVAVSRAYPQNDKGKSDLLIIDWTMSNKVLFLHSDTSFLYGVPRGVS